MLGQALHIFPAACFAHPQIAGAVLIPGAVCILEDSSFTPVVLCQQISEAIRNSCRLRCLTTLETCCCSFSFLPQLCARSLTMPHTHTHTHTHGNQLWWDHYPYTAIHQHQNLKITVHGLLQFGLSSRPTLVHLLTCPSSPSYFLQKHTSVSH